MDNFYTKIKALFLFFPLILHFGSYAYVREYTISDGTQLVDLFDKLSQDVQNPIASVPAKVVIKITKDIVLTSPAVFSAYIDPANGGCGSIDFVITSEDPDQIVTINGDTGSAGLIGILGCGSTNITLKSVSFANSYGMNRGTLSGSIILESGSGTIQIENCRFIRNLEHPVYGYEGGLRIRNTGGKVIIKRSIFFENSSTYNGAVYITSPDVVIENNLFTRNTTFSQTSGTVNIDIYDSSGSPGKAVILHNTIYGNFGSLTQNTTTGNQEATYGTGLSVGFSDISTGNSFVYIYNNIIYNNGVNTDHYLGVYKGLQVYIENSSSDYRRKNFVYLYNNNIGIDKGLFKEYGKDLTIDFKSGQSEQIWISDTGVVLPENRSLYQHSGNLSIDPDLISPYSLDPGDSVIYTDYSGYRLSSRSPLIDKGFHSEDSTLIIPVEDIDKDTRPIDGDKDGRKVVDIGFDEFKPEKSDNKSDEPSRSYSTVVLNISPKPSGGTVKTKNSDNIRCGTSSDMCSKSFPSSSKITLEAVPDNGYLFEGWNGTCVIFGCDINNVCSFTLPSDTDTVSCTAIFKQANTDNNSKDSKNGGGGCSFGFTHTVEIFIASVILFFFRKYRVRR